MQLLSFSKLDYVAKGRGQTGSDGIKWEPLAQSTIERKRKKAGLIEAPKNSKERQKNRKARRKRTRSGKPRPQVGAIQIGVDTGLQLASAAPGFRGPDGKGGNFFEIGGNQVTVGYNRSYSEFFDRKRPILPEEVPRIWIPPLERIVEKWADKILSDNAGEI